MKNKTKKILFLSIATFFAVFITDFIIHGIIMKSTYQKTAYLWRPEMAMKSFMPFMLLGQAMVALFFSWIFIHGYKGKGIGEGVRYGLLMSGFMAGGNLIMYSVMPYTPALVTSWIVLGVLQSVLLGVLCTVVADKT